MGPTVTSFTDNAVTDGTTYIYWVTAVGPPCPAAPVCGESVQLAFAVANIPATGAHSVALSWVLSTSQGVISQNVYRATVPTSPTGQAAAVQ